MAPFPSRAPNQVNTAISPKLRITMAGCALAFLAIIGGFFFVACKKRPDPRAATSSTSPSGPGAGVQPKQPDPHRCPNHHEPVRLGGSLPTAASDRGGCLVCASQPTADGRRGFEVPRSSHDSTRSLPPYTRHTTPTAALAIQPVFWPRRVHPSESTPASPTASGTASGTLSSPPPAYITVARGQTASLHRAVERGPSEPEGARSSGLFPGFVLEDDCLMSL